MILICAYKECLKEFVIQNRHYNYGLKNGRTRFYCCTSCAARSKVIQPESEKLKKLEIRRIKSAEYREKIKEQKKAVVLKKRTELTLAFRDQSNNNEVIVLPMGRTG